MPLPGLVTLVALSVAGTAVVMQVTGVSRARRFTTAEAAGRVWLRAFPDVAVTGVTLCRSGQAALIASTRGPGLVRSMGTNGSACFLTGATVLPSSGGVTLHLPDDSVPRVRLELEPEDVAHWTQRIGSC
ncbi:hypothetical protein [Mameliella alba]|uniref:hypothetical protein n=1 Tax=Mameliella alba TaxID=561184 RepID=UPI0014319DD7|nr:hypothetical protein [Mameliella alba]MBV6634654.1 hypothetical protein [Mameliella sp.]